jgi:hypothetical protein
VLRGISSFMFLPAIKPILLSTTIELIHVVYGHYIVFPP